MRSLSGCLALFLLPLLMPFAPAQGDTPVSSRPAAGENPYALDPFYADWPVALEYPTRRGLVYDRTRRQLAERIVANLQGGGRHETWVAATEFFWNAPEDVIEPLIAAMDRAFGDPSMQDMVRNCVEAMGRMGSTAFDNALQRALEHKNRGVRQSALGALALCGTDSTLRALHSLWPTMDGRSRQAWLRAARTRLGDEAVGMFRDLMMADFPPYIRDEVLVETLKLQSAQALEVLRGRWSHAVGEFKAVIAGVMNAAGDTTGTTWLRDTLAEGDLGLLPYAIRYATRGPIGDFRDELLSLSSHPRAEIRFELAKALRMVEGEDVADVYEILSHPDEPWQTKSLALRELTRRGRTAAATALLEEAATVQGTRLKLVLNMLGATGDPRAVPVFVRRFESAPEGQGRPFLQSLAVLGGDAAALALLEIFQREDVVVDGKGTDDVLSTRRYVPLLLMNLRGSADVVFRAFEQLPREQWQRRALLMPTVMGMAVDSEDDELIARAVDILRSILLDREQLPQLRVQALNLLTRRHLTLDDVLGIKNGLYDEKPGIRALLTDFLHDYF